MTVYVSIGNSDDKLTQAEWSSFVTALHVAVTLASPRIHGLWVSESRSPWQNACICFEVDPQIAEGLKRKLSRFAAEYRQDSIAWVEGETEFLKADPPSAATEADRG